MPGPGNPAGPGFVRRQTSQVAVIAKAGAAGVCAVYMVVFGIFLLIPGPVLIASSNDSNFQSDFFKSHNDTTRTMGIVLLCVSMVLLIGGVILCCYVRSQTRNIQQHHQTQGLVISGGGAPMGQVTGPVVTGPGQGYVAVPQGPSAGYVPPPQQPGAYPPSQQPGAYPPSQPVYPPPQPGYPPASYPTGQAYPPQGAASYPPAQPSYPTNQPSAPSAPPPSYADVAEKS